MRVVFDKKGYINRNYYSVNFYSTKYMKHWRNGENKAEDGINIMFKHDEISSILKNILYVEPQIKREKLKKMFLEAIEEGMNLPNAYNK